MLNHDIIIKYENSTLIKFKKCNHTQNINNIHFQNDEFICNDCSNLNGGEYFYSVDLGLQHKSEIERVCRLCKEKDKAINLTPIPQQVANGINFWFFHQDCMIDYGHSQESIIKILEDKTVKNKTSSLQKRKKSIKLAESNEANLKNPNISKNTLKAINERKIKNNLGIIINETDVGFLVVNKSYYDIDNIKGLCGVYSIYNKKSDKRYIGSTHNFSKRFKTHYSKLKKDKHHSYKLQEDFNRADEECFIFEILEVLDSDCKNKALHLTEQKYIDLTNASNKGYNIHPIAGFSGSATDYHELVGSTNYPLHKFDTP